jgi:hypothetical protein
MIFYKVDNITIGQFAKLTKDTRMVLRFDLPLPKKWIANRANKLIADFNKLNTKKDLTKLMEGYHKLSLQNRIINVLPTIFLGFQACYKIEAITGVRTELYKEFERLYEEVRGFKPTEADILGIPKFIDKLQNKLEDLYTDVPEEEPEPDFDFNYYVFTLERILQPMNIRAEKLITLQYLNEMAMKLQKEKTKEHGRD